MSSQKSLILNIDYTPLSIINADRAFVLWYKDRVYIEENYDLYFNTVDDKYPIPSIVRIKEYVKFRYDNVPFTKTNVFKRDGNQCVYCGSNRQLTIDHVIPTSKGGENDWNNVVTACARCNSEKGDLVDPDLPDKFNGEFNLYRPHAFMMMKKSTKKIPKSWNKYLFFI